VVLASKKESTPKRLKSARARLDAAMERLEKALAGINSGDDGAEIAALKGEIEKLTGVNKATGERLDGAIKRLKTVLKEV
jgi:hypothetical protein